MRHRTHRLRRVAATIALGVGAVGGVVGLAAGTAGAAVHATIKATSVASVGSTGTGVAAGNLTLTFPSGSGTTLSAKEIELKATPATGSVAWTAAPSIAKNAGTVAGETVVGDVLSFDLTKSATTAVTLSITGIEYNLTHAHGTITVTPSNPTTPVAVVFTPASVVNAKAPGAPATAPHTKVMTATSTPSVGRGTGMAAGNWTIKLTASTNETTAVGEGWKKTGVVSVTVWTPVTDTNCAGTNYVLFTGVPTATVSGTTKVSVTPTVSVSTAPVSPCVAADHNQVKVTFTNTGRFTGKTGTFTITLTGVKYQVGATTHTGNIFAYSAYTGTYFGSTKADVSAPTGHSNATIAKVFAKANTPAVTVSPGAFEAAISPISVVETAVSTVPAGGICLSLTPHTTSANVFHTKTTATVKVTTGDGIVTSKVVYENKTGAAATTAATAVFARFEITRESITTPSTYEVSGLKVNAATTPKGAVDVTITHVTASAVCTTTPTLVAPVTAFTITTPVSTVIYGATADATAVRQLETRFPGTTTKCPGTAGNRPVILATTKVYQDALSSSYLAGYLDTGTLLTPTTSLSSVTKQALRTLGITQVFVVGGPLAVTTTVVTAIETTPAYACGGVTPLKTGGHTVFIHVTRIYGETQYDTAQQIAQTVPRGEVARLAFTGAYAGVNATKGNGLYNDTAGLASTAPATSAAVPTAILASGVEFQDAMAASALAYATHVPVLLTTATALSSQASAAIATLGIEQVIVMGGPLAVTNTVVTSLKALGVSVLRIAGKTYTDTAVQLARFLQNTVDSTGRGWNGNSNGSTTGALTRVAVARGNGFTDGLAGAVITGHTRIPLLLTTSPTKVGTATTAFLKASGASGKGVNTDKAATISSLTIFGGPLAVSPAVIAAMEAAIA